jgi:hypothetical protein
VRGGGAGGEGTAGAVGQRSAGERHAQRDAQLAMQRQTQRQRAQTETQTAAIQRQTEREML